MADESQFAQMPPFLLNMTGGQKIASSLMNCVSVSLLHTTREYQLT